MASGNQTTNHQFYHVRDDKNILDDVDAVTCLLMKRGLWLAGYDATSQLLCIHFYSYSNKKPIWELDFYEHLFGNEPLLDDPDKVKAAFICSSRNMLVPDDLYDEHQALEWFRRTHMVEHKDHIMVHDLPAVGARYMEAVPMSIPALVKINCPKAQLLPFPLHHFMRQHDEGYNVHCSILPIHTCLTMYKGDKLLWHQAIDYMSAGDIAYEIMHYCRTQMIDHTTVRIHCDTATGAESGIIKECSKLFPSGNIVTAPAANKWDTAALLAHELIKCV